MVSLGTGVVVDSSGLLLTANHVVKDCLLPNHRILISGVNDERAVGYKPLLIGVSLNVGVAEFIKPISIDLVILEPIVKEEVNSFMELNQEVVSEGEEVLMAGFSDDIRVAIEF